MNRKVIISESEKNKILNLHINGNDLMLEDVVFVDWVSPDNKYVVFMDQLIEVDTKKYLGDIWKNADNLFLFLEHVYQTSNLRTTIKEEVSEFFSSRLLTESKLDLSPIKHLMKQYIKEGFWGDVWSGTKKAASAVGGFIKDTAVDTVTGITDTIVTGAQGLWQGIKDAGVAISKGDFMEVLKIISRGYLWVGRKIRQAAYSTVGMIIDAILVATGIGKVAQVVVWAIVVAVDIYELVSGDYEHPDEPLWLRILMFGCDILGLVFAGAAAKAARITIRSVLGGIRGSVDDIARSIAKSPSLIGLLKKMVGAVKEVPAKLSVAAGKAAKGGFWSKLFGKAFEGVGKFVQKFLDSITGLFTKKEFRPVLVQLGLIGGIGTYAHSQDKKLQDLQQSKAKKDAEIAKIKKEKEKLNKDLGKQSDVLIASIDKSNPELSDLNAWKND